MGSLNAFEAEKEDLSKTLRMFESLSRDHRIDISARIDAYHREELLREADKKNMAGKE